MNIILCIFIFTINRFNRLNQNFFTQQEVVRVALITQCRDYSEGLLYEVKQLKEELRSRGEECQNAVETVNRLREQIERDRAIIRENVPPERLLQLGHPYSSLVAIPPASAIPSITESANQAPPAPQAILSSMTPSQPTSQQSQPPTQQPQQPQPQPTQPTQQQHPPSQPLTQHQSEWIERPFLIVIVWFIRLRANSLDFFCISTTWFASFITIHYIHSFTHSTFLVCSRPNDDLLLFLCTVHLWKRKIDWLHPGGFLTNTSNCALPKYYWTQLLDLGFDEYQPR